ncbi:MAG: M48 family metalloprotease [Candidatus Micrarchaeota archaeon]
MTELYNQISSNKWKSYAIVLLFFLVIAAVVWFASYFFAGFGGFSIGIAGFLAILLALGGYYWGDKVVLAMSRAKPADENEHRFLLNTVEGLAIAAGLPKPKAYVIEDEAINAFATGRNPKNSSVAVTTGALKKLNRVELEGVIAHEMSHVKNYDIRLATLAVVMVGFVAILSDILFRGMLWGHGGRNENRGSGAIVVVGILFAVLAPIAVKLLQLALSRKREYLADATGALLTRHPKGLADALEKIGGDTRQLNTASEVTATLYIANPFKHVSAARLLSTHPPLEDRIARLRKM